MGKKKDLEKKIKWLKDHNEKLPIDKQVDLKDIDDTYNILFKNPKYEIPEKEQYKDNSGNLLERNISVSEEVYKDFENYTYHTKKGRYLTTTFVSGGLIGIGLAAGLISLLATGSPVPGYYFVTVGIPKLTLIGVASKKAWHKYKAYKIKDIADKELDKETIKYEGQTIETNNFGRASYRFIKEKESENKKKGSIEKFEELEKMPKIKFGDRDLDPAEKQIISNYIKIHADRLSKIEKLENDIDEMKKVIKKAENEVKERTKKSDKAKLIELRSKTYEPVKEPLVDKQN